MAGMPTRAGLAILEYSATAAEPHREGNVIIIPAAKRCPKCAKPLLGNWEFCPSCGAKAELQDGCCPTCRTAKATVGSFEMFPLKPDFEQFLLLQPPPVGSWWGKDGRAWFGGTDEAPFLVQMDTTVHDLAENPEEFYGHLIPPLMLTLIHKWGGDYRRQGDIFAFPLPYSWEKIREIGNFTKANGFPLQEAKNGHVFGTRHVLVGSWSRVMVAGKTTVIAEGTITAPDHSPMELKGPHVLDQTANLFDPKKAD